ncbi:MAG TPA: hypothetical protein VFF31_21475 [Blastocatellia bacterium]|nr:hypothetical protein [Blastocatellia bacterium]
MGSDKLDLSKLREILHSAIVEVEIAIDTGTHPDWAETKENLLKAVEIVRKLERDHLWSALSNKKR